MKKPFTLCESSFDAEDDVEIGMIAASERKDKNSQREEPADQSILTFPEFFDACP